MQLTQKRFAEYAQSPATFRDDLLIDVNGSVRRFGEVMDPWQRDDFAALDPGLMRCAGQAENPDAKMRAYLERSRGHSKTSDLSIIVCWALAFSTRPIRGYAYAADRDQAGLLKDACQRLLRLNPWLGNILAVQANKVVNIAKGHPGEGSSLDISASDVASSWGILPDLIIADELSHWEGDGSLWHSLISSAAKRETCLLCVISNAGFCESWQWEVREAARTDEDTWHFSRLDGPVASWLTEKTLAEQRRMLPNVAYQRLWLNQWAAAGGDALTPELIAAAFANDYDEMSGMEPGWSFVAGVDLGLVRDGSAIVVLAVPDHGRAGRIRLAHHRLWLPVAGNKVDLLDVERHLLELDARFNLEFVSFDPWQAQHLAATLEADSGHQSRNARRTFWAKPWMREIPPVANNLRQQASLTIESFQDRRVDLYDCPPLRRDLEKLRVEEKSYGIRLVSPRDGEGHGDSFSAFALALLMANEVASDRPVVTKVIDFDDPFDDTGKFDPFRELEERRKELQAEEDEFDEIDAQDPNGFKQAMREGRLEFSDQPTFPTFDF